MDNKMFCFQCQETAKNQGCTVRGVCGKSDVVANVQDVLIYSLKGLSYFNHIARQNKLNDKEADKLILDGLFTTITNANFDEEVISEKIYKVLEKRDEVRAKLESKGIEIEKYIHDSATFAVGTIEGVKELAPKVGVLSTADEDARSLRELTIYGLKGMAAYADHALNLGYHHDNISEFIEEALIATTKDLTVAQLVELVLKTGEYGVKAMALLDEANTSTYGNPEITKVNIGVGANPGILISGHDLKDMEELLEQTAGTGVDVYTHSEMLPANYYPKFKKYDHFVGNYGGSWWHQNKEFASFNGPILMTTNCITPVKDAYKDRMFTTGSAGYPGLKHIPEREEGAKKDFSEIIEMAKSCEAPIELEKGEIVGGFAHNQVMALADKVVDAVKSGAIKKFFVMGGCDGRMKDRQYYTDFAKALPKDTIILTAGCAKYRYNKLDLGDIGGIPRVLDAGQCNDSYSLAVIALKLQEVFELDDINELPIAFNIAWYEQKAVIVLLALLSLGVKNIHLGPTVPAFLSANVLDVLIKEFGISGISTVEADVEKLMKL
ncbi:MAG: hydroxylamine reductase [Firmicutes bacterium]|jgi:hydroxylamine reductase|nr:hydroxylamine reductase [Bacillota bacterium]